jgi:beta-lactamase superfamily II metal-dependent hydrolase
VLFTGDAGLPAEMGMLAAGAAVQANVLKVGHHGSRGSTSDTFLQAVNPQVAVIQSGVDNTYGHPHLEVLERLSGRTVLRNDLQGAVHIYSDGSRMWVEAEKPIIQHQPDPAHPAPPQTALRHGVARRQAPSP